VVLEVKAQALCIRQAVLVVLTIPYTKAVAAVTVEILQSINIRPAAEGLAAILEMVVKAVILSPLVKLVLAEAEAEAEAEILLSVAAAAAVSDCSVKALADLVAVALVPLSAVTALAGLVELVETPELEVTTAAGRVRMIAVFI
jgi:hypothetical protein